MLEKLGLLYTVEKVSDFPKDIIEEDLIGFLKEVQSYEWAMCQVKLKEPLEELKESLKNQSLLEVFKSGLSLSNLNLKLAYLETEVDSTRPMLNRYHKNRVRVYQKEDKVRVYLNGIPFFEINDESGFGLFAFSFDSTTGVIYYQKKEDRIVYAKVEDFSEAMSKTRLLHLLRVYFYQDNELKLISYNSSAVLDKIFREGHLGLMKAYDYVLEPKEAARDVIYRLMNGLTLTREEKPILKTTLLLSKESLGKNYAHIFSQFSSNPRRYMYLESQRDILVAMSRGIEVLEISIDKIDTFLELLPNWRNVKVGYILDETSLGSQTDTIKEKLKTNGILENSVIITIKQ